MKKVVDVSNKIWEAMTKKDAATLKDLIHEEAMFVHMTRTLSRDDEIAVIEEDNIVYKAIDLQETTVKEMESTVVLYNTLDLTAVVRGNEVTNHFVVTETYTVNGDTIKMSSLAFVKRV